MYSSLLRFCHGIGRFKLCTVTALFPASQSGWILKPCCALQCPRRGFKTREIDPLVEAKYKFKDGVPIEDELIYRAPYLWYVKSTYATTFVSLFVIPSVTIAAAVSNQSFVFPIKMYDVVLVTDGLEFAGFGIGLAYLTALVCTTVFKYPFRIYANSDRSSYTAVFQHFLPWKNYKLQFQPGDVRAIKGGILPWHESLFLIKNKQKAILLSNFFTRPIELEVMVRKA